MMKKVCVVVMVMVEELEEVEVLLGNKTLGIKGGMTLILIGFWGERLTIIWKTVIL
jgi:hypothetical protein